MQTAPPHLSDLTPDSNLNSESELAREEAKINRVSWASLVVAATLAAAAAVFLVLTEADRSWQYLVYPLLTALPLAYGIISALYTRRMHVSLLHRHQTGLLIRSAELQEKASKDELTKLYNRRYFYECLQAQLGRARARKEPLALLLLDIDDLKGINDEYGHLVGDTVIANLGKVIAKHTRNSDAPARLGGDEFGVVMSGTDKRGAFAMAQRLWAELEQTPMFEANGTSIIINVSIGVSGFPWGGEDVDEMMHWADADMYVNKASRRLPPQPVPVTGPGDLDALPDDLAAGI